MLTFTNDGDELLAAADDWESVLIEIVLDNGACSHVMARESAPGYPVRESPGGRKGQHIVLENGERVQNEGKMALNFEANADGDEAALLSSTFQVTDLTRLLMSVSQICEQRFRCMF